MTPLAAWSIALHPGDTAIWEYNGAAHGISKLMVERSKDSETDYQQARVIYF